MRGWTLVVLGLLWAGCKADPPPPPEKPKAPKKAAPAASSWKEIETPVPVGKKLACGTILPADKLGPLLAKKVELVDESVRDPDATAVCRLMNVDKKGKVGDEVCMASVYCSSVWNVADMKKRCDARGEQSFTDDVGLISCIQRVPAGEKERHVITSIDGDTRCKVVVNAAPNQFDLAQTRACARAVVDTLEKSSLSL
jgi:hypothetical protein